jgi:hypothetical protein
MHGLLRDADLEVAAFIIRDEAGNLQCAMWPDSEARLRQQYRAPLPGGTVAIVHTHPWHAFEPSVGDLQEAQRLQIPVVVVTRWSIGVADPGTGRRFMLVERRNWRRTATAPSTPICRRMARVWGL